MLGHFDLVVSSLDALKDLGNPDNVLPLELDAVLVRLAHGLLYFGVLLSRDFIDLVNLDHNLPRYFAAEDNVQVIDLVACLEHCFSLQKIVYRQIVLEFV